ncbi:hypothetical protein SAMN06269185_3264 [Natronoarchaeum philippinense]|uniref:Uncharacterized protein n=1 Tax=Natronoarchaeum philippinense TaxID=558529 RepID=A0A285PAB5_NATPI|nr:hypothetical protein [Natronoarchaeum philippinense]SNZ18153.1 hypothetical protein SAMN06269185_3264 [Natronoarchaeum philippinense]
MTNVFVEPDDTAAQLREYVRSNPGVRKDEYDYDDVDPVEGACYLLAEAYFHATSGRDAFDVYRLDWSEVSPDYEGAHWFLRRTADDIVVDLSLPTPEDGVDVPWDVARHRAFITGYTPSNRTQTALSALGLES